MEVNEKALVMEEKVAKSSGGMGIMLITLLLWAASLAASIYFFYIEEFVWAGMLLTYFSVAGWIPLCGLKILHPNEAYVLTLFGKYLGTLRGPGFFWVNPFVSAINPVKEATRQPVVAELSSETGKASASLKGGQIQNKRISLKAMTLNNDKQKINDKLGNPIIIGIVVIWRVTNTARAVFNVDNYAEYLSIQCDSALRNIVRLYPYDASDDADFGEKSLRGSSVEISKNLRDEIQSKVDTAGLEIMEARITHLSYAPEIAAAMLQRQQASAIIDARQMIVEGAVGMVEMALQKLGENDIVQLDEERKAAMVSNLLVVLCGNKEAQPVVNSGTLY